MTKRIALILACSALASMFSFNVQALPISFGPAHAPESNVILAAGGCGIGFHRGPYGGCLRNGVYGPVVVAPYGAPVVVAPYAPPVVERPVCPYGYRFAYGQCYPY
jgi:hypothetical protein